MKILLKVFAIINIIIGSLTVIMSFGMHSEELVTFVVGGYWITTGIVMYQASKLIQK